MVKAAEKQGDRKDPLKNHERVFIAFFQFAASKGV